jgi:hypothetical protein
LLLRCRKSRLLELLLLLRWRRLEQLLLRELLLLELLLRELLLRELLLRELRRRRRRLGLLRRCRKRPLLELLWGRERRPRRELRTVR